MSGGGGGGVELNLIASDIHSYLAVGLFGWAIHYMGGVELNLIASNIHSYLAVGLFGWAIHYKWPSHHRALQLNSIMIVMISRYLLCLSPGISPLEPLSRPINL